MNRDQKIKFLVENCGYGEELLKAAPDELIEQMYQHEQEGGEDTAPAGGEGTPDTGAPDAPMASTTAISSTTDAPMASTTSTSPDAPMASTSPAASTSPMASTSPAAVSSPMASTEGGAAASTSPPAVPNNDDLHPPPSDAQFDDSADPAMMSDEERQAYADHYAAMYRKHKHYKANGEPAPMKPAATPPAPQAPAMSGYKEMGQFISAEIGRQLAPVIKGLETKLTGQLGQLNKFAESEIAAKKKASIDARLDVLVRQGKVLPAWLDAGLADSMMTLDAQTPHKFSETKSGKVVTFTLTPLDNFFRALESGPKLTEFRERAKTGTTNPTAGDDEAEVEKVALHYESFKENFPRNVTKESLIEGFKASRKHDKTMTASRFLDAG